MIAFFLLNTLVVIALAGLTFAFYGLLRRVPRSQLADSELPFISVVVPARNEEDKVARCLASLVNQNYPHYEIVVIDDRSTDSTGEIIERFASVYPRIKFVQGKNLPDGWIGKCNALVHASTHASGEFIIFTDADTCHQPNSLRDAVTYSITNEADLISFVPVQELGSFWEKTVMPVLLGSFLCGDPFHTINDQSAERAYAYGQYILVRRSAYLSAGGHQSVRDEIVEDHALARVMKRKGFRVLCGDGHDLYKVRMYTNLRTLWLGWTKNVYSLIEAKPFNLFLVLVLINCAALAPFVQLLVVASMIASGHTDGDFSLLTIFLAAEFSVLLVWFWRTGYHYEGIKPHHFALVPLGSLSVTVLYLHSAYLVLGGGQVNWKGRRYTVNSSRTIESTANSKRETVLDAALTKVTD